MSAEAAIGAVETVREDDFFRYAHKQVFMGMVKVVERTRALDVVTLVNELRTSGSIEGVGGPSYISALMDGVPRSVNWPYYADIMRELRGRRDLIYYANKVSSAAYSGEDDSATVRQHADEWLFEVGTPAKSDELVPQDKAFHSFIESLALRCEKRDELLGASTGIKAIDDFTAGMVPQELTVLAAGTGGGKSALALNIATSIAKAGGTVLYFSMEMTREELEFRIASTSSGVPLFKIRKGWLTENELSRIGVEMARTSEMPLFIDENLDLTVRELRARTRKAARTGKLSLVVVDYFQLLTPIKRKDGRRDAEFAEMSRGCKKLSREFKVPVLLLSQLSRGDKQRRRPELWDLKETSALEQDADQVWFLYHENDTDGKVELLVRKARSGPTGTVELMFEKHIVRFYDPQTQGAYMEPMQAPLMPT